MHSSLIMLVLEVQLFPSRRIRGSLGIGGVVYSGDVSPHGHCREIMGEFVLYRRNQEECFRTYNVDA